MCIEKNIINIFFLKVTCFGRIYISEKEKNEMSSPSSPYIHIRVIHKRVKIRIFP